jgi:hypothetical protein
MRTALLILCFLSTGISASPAPRATQEIVLGRVVAYSISPACLNEKGYWALIIRVQQPNDVRSNFVRVDFTLPCKARPEWLFATPPTQEFHLLRQKDCDAVLIRYAAEEPEKLTVPQWTYLRGIKPDMIPFGQVVPCYRPVDAPVIAPVF